MRLKIFFVKKHDEQNFHESEWNNKTKRNYGEGVSRVYLTHTNIDIYIFYC